ncbi:flippase-like domain-containing protein [Reichenbachiella agarivorans]|uniref:Flippase-like domain-containing protein n=1 Tax=Reichenbachiella agarivorans TaxID=2979464 RepID=A0ABY6CK01_9BACT|nr:flippase-like domain-containing protein [Reichenbachiella agarivorans]UXP30847.1 flippase-like domain-containing protein [Reichenbachiella agarivorans]
MEFLRVDHLRQRAVWFYPVLRILWVWVIPVAVLSMVVFKIHEGDFNWSFFHLMDMSWLLVAVSLLPLNLLIEAYAWYYLIRDMDNKSFVEVWKVTLIGRSVNVLTPFGLGDAVVRLGDIARQDRVKAVSALAVVRFSQMVPTFIFGSVSVFFLILLGAKLFSLTVVLGSCLGVFLMLVIAYLSFKDKIHSQMERYRLSFMNYQWRQWLYVLLLSSCRYVIFSLQFLMVFYVLKINLDAHIILLGVFWIFLIKTFIPNVTALGDLMNRELSAALFFSFFHVDMALIGIASALIWLVNIILPALIGLLFISGFSRKHL